MYENELVLCFSSAKSARDFTRKLIVKSRRHRVRSPLSVNSQCLSAHLYFVEINKHQHEITHFLLEQQTIARLITRCYR